MAGARTARSRPQKPRGNVSTKRPKNLGDAPRQEAAAHRSNEASPFADAIARLERLYAISLLLAHFESAEESAPRVLAEMSRALPLRSANLLLRARRTNDCDRTFSWRARGLPDEDVTAAQARARAAFDYFARARPASAPTTHPDAELSGFSLGAVGTSGERSFVVLPLVVPAGEVFGVLQVEGSSPLDEVDLVFVNAIVNQLAVALDRAIVVEARQAESDAGRNAAEASERRQRFLSEAGAQLTASLDYRRTLSSLARLSVPFVADVCVADEIVDGARVERIEVVVADPAKQHLAGRLGQLPASTPLLDRLRLQRSLLIPDVASSAEAGSQAGADAALLSELGVQSVLVVPLVVRDRTLGVLTFMTAESGRRYAPSDLAFAEELGRRAALALDNAKLFEQVERAVQDRQDLLAIVSHDLRGPLNTIALSVSLLSDAVAPEDRKKLDTRALPAIQRAADRMRRLIDDLLDVAAIEAGRLSVERTTCLAASLVRDVADQYKEIAAGKSVRLEAETLCGSLEVACDRDRLVQVFGNLVGNAIKFTPEGGAIALRAERRGQDVLFSVSDTGPGIPPNEISRVFDRYWQARRTRRAGAGLGLAIAKGLVEAHGGTIWAESKLGNGSAFRVTLPIAPHAVDSAPEAERSNPAR